MKTALIISIIINAILLWYANGLRIDNVGKNKQLEVEYSYKCAWEDFNKSFIPSTALPRLPDIEAIYKEETK